MNCTQVSADFNISQPGTYYSGYLIYYVSATGDVQNADATPPLTSDPNILFPYTTDAGGLVLKVFGLPPGDYIAEYNLNQYHDLKLTANVIYQLYYKDGGSGAWTALEASRRIRTGGYVQENHIVHGASQKFTITATGVVLLKFARDTEVVFGYCENAVLRVIKLTT